MVSISALIYRGKIVESRHKALCLVKNISNKDILSTDNSNQLIYPRSAIKIFQAIPFINSNAHIMFNLSKKHIAISCSSHTGEPRHISVLREWISKTKLNINQLKCGIHNPLNEKASDKLLLSGEKSSQIHNNCAGKHLGMISGCLANKMPINNYIDFDHPYQKLIRDLLENFMEIKIQKNNIGTDGCGAPQYAFPCSNITTSMINLIKTKDSKNKYSNTIKKILFSITKFPLLIGGHNNFDSNVIKSTKGRIFCKGGAEGVLLFTDFTKKIGGVIKILDGNNRAIPSIAMKVFQKLKLLSTKELKELKKLNFWTTQKLYNHAKKEVGKITAELK